MSKFRNNSNVHKFLLVHASSYNFSNHERHINRCAVFKHGRATVLARSS